MPFGSSLASGSIRTSKLSEKGVRVFPRWVIQCEVLLALVPRNKTVRTTILSALGPDHVLTVLFLGIHTRTSQWVTHHGIALVRTQLNFGVPMEPEAIKLSKCLVLGRDENIHIRLRESTPLGDV
ncbi:hypothetical protein DVH24_019164 [Malus domestica]|uniref:Uncharacterized protein n=1 Tax=Malus domestica TaxID=3750 RepID=A0A498HY03_MALDO|nr:hypothetical protein DVH24_019164 [Malus domestica]